MSVGRLCHYCFKDHEVASESYNCDCRKKAAKQAPNSRRYENPVVTSWLVSEKNAVEQAQESFKYENVMITLCLAISEQKFGHFREFKEAESKVLKMKSYSWAFREYFSKCTVCGIWVPDDISESCYCVSDFYRPDYTGPDMPLELAPPLYKYHVCPYCIESVPDWERGFFGSIGCKKCGDGWKPFHERR